MEFSRPHHRLRRAFCASVVAGALALRALGQIAVTAVDYGTPVDTTNRTAGNITYNNTYTPVEYISSSLGTYSFNAGNHALLCYAAPGPGRWRS